MILTANAFPRLHTVKTALGDSLKSAVSENPLAVNIVEGNTCETFLKALLSYFLPTPKGNDLENISLIQL